MCPVCGLLLYYFCCLFPQIKELSNKVAQLARLYGKKGDDLRHFLSGSVPVLDLSSACHQTAKMFSFPTIWRVLSCLPYPIIDCRVSQNVSSSVTV